MNKFRYGILTSLSCGLLILSFQNCSKTSQFYDANSSLAQDNVGLPAENNDDTNANLPNGSDNPSTFKFEKIKDLTVNTATDYVYVLNGKKIHKFKGVSNPSISLVNFKQDSSELDPAVSYQQVGIDSNTNSIVTLEYRNNVFYGVKRYFNDGSYDYPIKSNVKDYAKPVIVGNTTKSYSIDGNVDLTSIKIERVAKKVLLKFRTSTNAYWWMNIADQQLLSIWEYYCLRTGKCDGSANLTEMALLVSSNIQIITDEKDSKDNIYMSNPDSCMIGVKLKSNNTTNYIGQTCH